MGIGALLLISVLGGVAAAGETSSGGRPLEVDSRVPLRIVSATLSADEILLSLLPPQELVAVGVFSSDPRISNVADRARGVSRHVTADPEQLLPLRPTVLFADPFTSADSRALLRRVGVPVLRLRSCQSLSDIRQNVLWVGGVVRRTEGATALVAEMDRRIARVERLLEGAKRPRVLLYNAGGFTAGAHTLFDEMLRIAGGRNVAADARIEGHSLIDVERILFLDPEIILVTEYRADARVRKVAAPDTLVESPGWEAVAAVREGHVHEVPARYIMTTSHFAGQGVEVLAQLLHPQRFSGERP
jgi:iron complex transport system substrate-binding protein